MTKRRLKLITSDEAVSAKSQHTKPCTDCPWARDSLPGWLGGETVKNWLLEGHSDNEIPCHVFTGAQCAGAAIYRRNVCKRVEPPNLKLEADKVRVFATPMEFRAHHERRLVDVPPTTTPEVSVMPKANVIAANLKIGSLKAKHANKVDKLIATHSKKLAATQAKAEKAGERVKKDLQAVLFYLNAISDAIGGVSVADGAMARGKDVVKLRDKIYRAILRSRKVLDKYDL